MHEKVWLPAFVDLANILAQESNVIWPDRALHKWHFCLIRGLAALPVVAPDTGADQILPGVLTSTGLRDHVIDSKRDRASPAVLALMAVASEYILSRQDHLLEGYPDVV